MKIAQFFKSNFLFLSFWVLCVKYNLRMFSWDSPTNLPTDMVKPAQIWLLRLCPEPLASDALKRAILQLLYTPRHRDAFGTAAWSLMLGGASPVLSRATGVCLSQQHRERRSTTDPHFSPERNLMLDYSWRCKYKPLALLPLLLHY